MKSIYFAVLAVGIVWSSESRAQLNAPPAADLHQDGADAAPPDITASDMLGTSFMSVPRPGDTRALQLHLPMVMRNRGVGAGFGLTASPFRSYLWERSWEERNVPQSVRWLSGLSVSLAVANVPTVAEHTKLTERTPSVDHFYTVAATAGFDLVNQRDPLRDPRLASCLDEKARQMAPEYAWHGFVPEPTQESRRLGPVSRERISSCLHGPTYAVGVGGGTTDNFAALWASYELGLGEHAITGKVGRRFAHRLHENTIDLGLRYSLDTAHVSPTVDATVEIWPTSTEHPVMSTRYSSGGGLTFALPKGLSMTVGMRIITPYSGEDAPSADYRGYLSFGWGGYDVLNEYFARSLERQAVRQ